MENAMGFFGKSNQHQDALIEEDAVNLKTLQAVLTAAYMECELDRDGDLYIADGLEYPIWVMPDFENISINLYSTHQEEGIATLRFADRINQLNSIRFCQYRLDGDALHGNYWFFYNGGLYPKLFVRSIRQFSSAFIFGIRKTKSGVLL